MSKKGLWKNKVLTVIVLMVALGLFIYRIKDDLNIKIPMAFGNEKTPKSEDANEVLKNVEIDTSQIEVNEEFFNSMSEKELIHYKMINSIDFFDSVEGEIKKYSIINGSSTAKYTIDLINNRSKTQRDEDNKNIHAVFNKDTLIEFNDDNKTYQNMRVFKVTKDEMEKLNNYRKLKPKLRYDKNDVILDRRPDVVLDVGYSIMGCEFLTNYLRNYDVWEITGTEDFIGRKCTRVVGEMGLEDSNTFANNYAALIDSETGVVLKLEHMTSDGTVVSSFETTYIKYNETYDENIFDTSTEGYSSIN